MTNDTINIENSGFRLLSNQSIILYVQSNETIANSSQMYDIYNLSKIKTILLRSTGAFLVLPAAVTGSRYRVIAHSYDAIGINFISAIAYYDDTIVIELILKNIFQKLLSFFIYILAINW